MTATGAAGPGAAEVADALTPFFVLFASCVAAATVEAGAATGAAGGVSSTGAAGTVAAEVAAALTPFFGLAPSGLASGVSAATGIWLGRGVGAATGAAGGAAAAEDAAALPLAAFGLVADAVMAKITLYDHSALSD